MMSGGYYIGNRIRLRVFNAAGATERYYIFWLLWPQATLQRNVYEMM